MKISPDQNTITLDDGTVLVASDSYQYVEFECLSTACDSCELRPLKSLCNKASCMCFERSDQRDVIFIKEQKND